MFNSLQEQARKAYLYADIMPDTEGFQSVCKIIETFETEGADRLAYALQAKHMGEQDVTNYTEKIAYMRQKMQRELKQMQQLADNFVQEYATNHNQYFGTMEGLLQSCRSHLSALKSVLRRFTPRKPYTDHEMEKYGIESKALTEQSFLSCDCYQPQLFDLAQQSEPVQQLTNELTAFFEAEQMCMKLCSQILAEQEKVRQDANMCLYLLSRSKEKAYRRIRNLIAMIGTDTIELLKQTNPVYLKRAKYSSDAEYAQGEYHMHNEAEMDHLCLIEAHEANLPKDAVALWGNDAERIGQINKAIANFDRLLPYPFSARQMGLYMGYFCQWALPDNYKAATHYFGQHYKGRYRAVSYSAVNSHRTECLGSSDQQQRFLNTLEMVLNEAKTPKSDAGLPL